MSKLSRPFLQGVGSIMNIGCTGPYEDLVGKRSVDERLKRCGARVARVVRGRSGLVQSLGRTVAGQARLTNLLEAERRNTLQRLNTLDLRVSKLVLLETPTVDDKGEPTPESVERESRPESLSPDELDWSLERIVLRDRLFRQTVMAFCILAILVGAISLVVMYLNVESNDVPLFRSLIPALAVCLIYFPFLVVIFCALYGMQRGAASIHTSWRRFILRDSRWP